MFHYWPDVYRAVSCIPSFLANFSNSGSVSRVWGVKGLFAHQCYIFFAFFLWPSDVLFCFKVCFTCTQYS